MFERIHHIVDKMFIKSCSVVVMLVMVSAVSSMDPTLYEYYSAGGIHSGLVANSSEFVLNGKPIVLMSGTLHYFRVLPQRWRSTLLKMRAAGLNAVQTYVAWNAHEDVPGVLDFHSPQLNLSNFLEEVRQADMFAVIRPGPFICAEWEFGGLPSWLLRDSNMAVRTNYAGYIKHVEPYWNKVMSIVNDHRFSVNGGPVVMVQLENEYGGWVKDPEDEADPGLQHLQYLHRLSRASGYEDLLFTCDNGGQARRDPVRSMTDVLEVLNGNNMAGDMARQAKLYPDRPLYVSEFWNGWFDGWLEHKHNRMSLTKFSTEAENVLIKANGSINFYPFIGGTNFGFMNGAYVHQGNFPNIRVATSWDFDAPLTEAGNYTDKYEEIRKLHDKLVASGRVPKLRMPDTLPPVTPTKAYGKVSVSGYYPLEVLLKHAHTSANMHKPVSMENLNLGHGYGQRFGFVLYRVHSNEVIENFEVTGPLADRATLLVNGHQALTVLDAPNLMATLAPEWFTTTANATTTNTHKLDVLVENMGRPCDSDPKVMAHNTRKGITSGDIRLDGQTVHNVTIYSLDFEASFLEQVISTEKAVSVESNSSSHFATPALFVAHLNVDGQPVDTFVQLPGWTKGQIFVNGFNLGRYWSVGPQKTLFVPAQVLNTGSNHLAIFELHHSGHGQVEFIDSPILG